MTLFGAPAAVVEAFEEGERLMQHCRTINLGDMADRLMQSGSRPGLLREAERIKTQLDAVNDELDEVMVRYSKATLATAWPYTLTVQIIRTNTQRESMKNLTNLAWKVRKNRATMRVTEDMMQHIPEHERPLFEAFYAHVRALTLTLRTMRSMRKEVIDLLYDVGAQMQTDYFEELCA
jgi:hypothetical protein